MSSEPGSPLAGADDKRAEYLIKTMGMYQDSAKAFVSLATATLLLTVTFREKVFGEKSVFGRIQGGSTRWEHGFLFVAWICLVAAVGCGTLYQYVAVKHVELNVFGKSGAYVPPALRKYADQPGVIYGLMLAAFALGAVFFFIYAAIQLWR